jgi:hypothetical protein
MQFVALESSSPGAYFLFCRTIVAVLGNMASKDNAILKTCFFLQFHWLKFTPFDIADIFLPFSAIF